MWKSPRSRMNTGRLAGSNSEATFGRNHVSTSLRTSMRSSISGKTSLLHAPAVMMAASAVMVFSPATISTPPDSSWVIEVISVWS